MKLTTEVHELLDWIDAFLGRSLGLPPRAVHVSTSFHEMGVDSVVGTEMAFALGEHLGVEIDPTLLFDCRTIRGFAEQVHALVAMR